VVEENIGRGDKRGVGGITEMNRLFLLGLMPVILLVVPHNAFAWDFGSLFNGFEGQGQGFHHWGFNNYGQGYQPYNNGFLAGIADAQYDHKNNLVYNPYPQCCRSEFYQHAFHEGYDQQWNIYRSQEQ
jgi:hypothetical protein